MDRSATPVRCEPSPKKAPVVVIEDWPMMLPLGPETLSAEPEGSVSTPAPLIVAPPADSEPPNRPPVVVIEDWPTTLPLAPVRPRATLTKVALDWKVCVADQLLSEPRSAT